MPLVPTQWTQFNWTVFTAEAGTHLPTLQGWKAELDAWLHTEIDARHLELNPDAVANWARRRLTSLIEANHYARPPDRLPTV